MKPWMPLLSLALMTACSQPPPAPTAARPEAPKRDLVAEVRAVGAGDEDALDVKPLRDPKVEDLRASAARAELSGQFEQADSALQLALSLSPDDPELLQYRAEIALQRDRLADAVEYAHASWQKGPKLGPLCRRNWVTIRLARELTGDANAATAAAAQTQRCTVEPPVRM